MKREKVEDPDLCYICRRECKRPGILVCGDSDVDLAKVNSHASLKALRV